MGLIPRPPTRPPLEVHALRPGEESAWETFRASCGNDTLFHDLGFLAYHPADRFRFHHLVVGQGHDIVAVVPGGLVAAEDGVAWRSPVGASFGGPVLAPRPRLTDVLAIVAALQDHARTCGWQAIDMIMPPPVYDPRLGDLATFALFRSGFRERHQWLCPMIDIGAVRFEKRQRQALRGAIAKGAVATETGLDGLAEFGRVFEETYARHGASPTHSLAEIELLLRRFPDRIRLVLARQDGHVTAGLLVMQITPTVATTFYICSSAGHLNASGPIVAISALIERLGERGSRWLDLGPSASDTTLNPGVMFFKEGLGAVGYSRSHWSWTTAS